MDLILIIVLVGGIAWFAIPRISKRRRDAEDDALARGGFWGMGMLSWLPAWMILGGMTQHDPGDGGGAPNDPGSGWGGGDSFGGGGGDLGGGGFGGGD